MQTKTYEASGRLLLKVDRQSALVGLVQNPDDLTLDVQSSVLNTEAQILRSVPVAQRVIDTLGLVDDAGTPLRPQEFLAGLKVTPVGGTDVLAISYVSSNPEEAAAIVNELADAYVQQTIDLNQQDVAEARQFISEQLPRTEESVRDAEAALRDFKEANGIVVLDEEARVSVNRLTSLQTQLTDLRSQLADANARVVALQGQLGLSSQEALVVSSLSQAAGIQSILQQLQAAESDLAVQRTRYREAHPAIATAERRVAALQDALSQQVERVAGPNNGISIRDLQVGDVERQLMEQLLQAEAARAGLQEQLTVLVDMQNRYRDRANVLPRLEQTQRELERKLLAAQTTYETLLTRLQEIQVTENQNISNARLISPALVPENPTNPSKKVFLALGGVAGLMLGITTALLLDIVDRSLKTVKEARDLFAYTLLGIIPSFGRSGRLWAKDPESPIPRIVAQDFPHSSVAEAYQMLQANLRFLSSDRQIKSMVVTSSAPREGKSEVVANLAVAIAQVGNRVLLVDADMRHPSQHHAWDLTNGMGLSNVLVDQMEYSMLVQRVMPNLDVLTAGVIPPNPVALLDSNRMRALIEQFSQDYDYVLFDTPPLSGTADASVLGQMVDGLMLVVRPGVVNYRSAKATRDFLAQANQPVLGIVVNGVDTRTEPDSYFYYSQEYQGDRTLPGGAFAQSLERTLTSARERGNSHN